MDWLFPALVATITSTFALCLVYAYLYLQDRERSLGIWTLGWIFYLLRFVFMLLIVALGESPWLRLGNLLAVLVSSLFLAWGGTIWIERQLSRYWLLIFAACAIWNVVAIWGRFSFPVLTLPTYVLLGVIYIGLGALFLRYKGTYGPGKQVVGWTLVLWGIHKMDYPFLQPVAWFAPWGYLLGSLFGLVLAIGIILVYFERTKEALIQSEGRYRTIFDTTAVSIWEEDFSQVKAALDQVAAQGVVDFRRYLDEHPEFLQRAAEMIRVLDVNKATLKMLGASSKQALLGALDKVLMPETMAILREQVAAIAEGQAEFAGETVNRTLLGEQIDVLLTMAIPSEAEQFDNVLVSLMDITPRRQVEEALRERLHFETLLSGLSAAFVNLASHDFDSVVELWLQRLAEFLTVDRVSVLEFCAERDEVQLTHSYATPGIPPMPSTLAGHDQPWYVGRIHSGQITVLEHLPDDLPPDALDEREFCRQTGLQSSLILPLSAGGIVLGAITFGTLGAPRAWPEDLVQRLRLVGEIFASALIRQRTENTLAQRNRELALLNRAGQALSATLDLEEVLTILVQEVHNLLGNVACSVWLLTLNAGIEELVCRQATGPRSEVVRGWRLAPGEGLAGWVAQSGESLYIPDVRKDSRHFTGVDAETGVEVRSLLSVPLHAGPKVLGVLQVVDTVVHRFQITDVALVESLAATAAISIENAHLFAQEEHRGAELVRVLKQRQELDRLKNEFMQNVSHELRTPLAIARGYAELLDSGVLGPLLPDQQEPVSIIARRIRMLGQMIEDIATILANETRDLRRDPVNLTSIVQAMLGDFQAAAANQGLTLSFDVAANLPPVHGDATQLQRVVDNLVGNALKFTPAGGRIALRLWQERENLLLEVADTGIGIPAEQLERIFERFYQVDGSATRRYGGTGLGLALVKEIVQAHGGQVTVQSKPGEGSTFCVVLPLPSDSER